MAIKCLILSFFHLITARNAAALKNFNIPASELHYVPRHPEVLDMLPNDFGPVIAGPEEPQKEEIPSPPPPPPAQLQLQLGGSLEQLLREGGRPGSSLEKLKSEFAAYLPKIEALASRKTLVLQMDFFPAAADSY